MTTINLESVPRRFICTACGDVSILLRNISESPAVCPRCGGDAYPEFPSGQGAVAVIDDPGHLANGVLRASGDYTAAETITIGADVYKIDPITTDSTDDCAGGFWANTTDPLTVEMLAATYPVTGVGGTKPLVVGELIYLGTEYLRVTAIVGNNVTFERGAGGSTIASHANGVAIKTSAATVAPTYIPVGVQTTLTAAAVTPILAATINEDPGTPGHSNDVTAVSLASGATLLIVADAVGPVNMPTAETGTNLAWDTTAMRRGASAGRRRVFAASIVPDSEEVTAGIIYVPLPFDPTVAVVQCRVTATGLEGGSSSTEPWDGAVLLTVAAAGVPAYLTINNGGGSDWDNNDTLYILAME